MVATRGNFADILTSGQLKIYLEHFKRLPLMYDKVFQVSDSQKQTETVSEVAGFGLLQTKSEAASVNFSDPSQMYDYTYTHLTYALGYQIAEELVEDDLYNIINRLPASLAISSNATIETIAANVLNRAFNSSYTFGDGQELCATEHPLKGGAVQANEPSSAVDLSLAALEAAYNALARTTDFNGLLLNIRPSKLLIPPELKFDAEEILKSELKPYTSNNERNALMGTVEYMTWTYMTDTDAWFLLSNDNMLRWIWRVKPQFKPDTDFNTGNLKYKARMRCSVGADGPWGVYGSPGV